MRPVQLAPYFMSPVEILLAIHGIISKEIPEADIQANYFKNSRGRTIFAHFITRPQGTLRWYIDPAFPGPSCVVADVIAPGFKTEQRGDFVVILTCFHKFRYWDPDESWDAYPNLQLPDAFSDFRGLESNLSINYEEGLQLVLKLAQVFQRHTS